jgi:ABC-2 type transport system permease protein
MSRLSDCFQIELMKARKSAVYGVTWGVMAFFSCMMGFMMFIMKNPDLARRLGILGAKARIVLTAADWPSYFNLLAQGMPMVDMFLLGFAVIWIFGREYVDRTAKDLLALPVPRHVIVIAKFQVITAWGIGLHLSGFFLAIAAGALVKLPGWEMGRAVTLFWDLAFVCLVTMFLNSAAAFIASCTRGYLAPIGYLMFTAVMINLAMGLGFAEYCPWAAGILYAMRSVMNVQLITASWVIVFITGLLGFAGTYAWWRYADQV